MKVVNHTAISLILGAALYTYLESFSCFLWVLITGIFIDIDHYIDYAISRGMTLNPKKISDALRCDYLSFKKIILFLHSYELVIILWLAIFIFGLNSIWKCAATGFTAHLFLDQAFNPVKPLGYFLSFRIANNFEPKKIFVKRKEGKLWM